VYTINNLINDLQYTYAELIAGGISFPGFIFDISSSYWNTLSTSTRCQVKNENNSFVDLSYSFIQNATTNITTVFVTWKSYTNQNRSDGMTFYNNSHSSINILQFGGIPLSAFGDTYSYWSGPFSNFAGSISAKDTPSITNDSLAFCFFRCKAKSYGNLGAWDVSKVSNMLRTFSESNYNGTEIASWNMSNVTTINCMFQYCSTFNQSLTSWKFTKLIDMAGIFAETSFAGDVGSWNTSMVTDMTGAFFNCGIYGPNVGYWNFSNATVDAMFGKSERIW
jgi:hypothetical protein